MMTLQSILLKNVYRLRVDIDLGARLFWDIGIFIGFNFMFLEVI